MAAVKRERSDYHVEVPNACCCLCVHQSAWAAAECTCGAGCRVLEILKHAYAMEPGTQKEIIIDHGDGLCSKVIIEPSTDEALNAFIDPDAARNFAVPLR